MTKRAEQLKDELIEKVADLVKKRLEGERAKITERFVRTFLGGVPPIDLIEESIENLYGASLSIYNFANKREGSEPKIRVYNPQQDEHGWRCSHTVIEIINDDMPFLVDSVTAELERLEAGSVLVIHPIIRVERESSGKIKDFPKSEKKGHTESMMHVQIPEQPENRHKEIAENLRRVLDNVRVAVEDWRKMRARVEEILKQLETSPPSLDKKEIEETKAFLEWVNDDHFTYLGYREYSFEGRGQKAVAKIDEKRSLGILRDSDFSVFDGLRNLGTLPPDVQDFVRQPTLLRITKANRRSTVHRPVHLDTIVVKCFDKNGKVTGERLIIGLFTSVAYSRSPRAIPVLREKVARVMELSGVEPSSHDGKAIQHILENYPRDELFQVRPEDLLDTVMGILHLQDRRRTALFVRYDPFERFVSCLVFTPRDRFDTNLRLKFQGILAEAFEGEVVASYTQLSDEALARVHALVKTKQGEIPEVDLEDLEDRLAEAARSWADRLEEALIDEYGEERGVTYARRYQRAFPTSYQDRYTPHLAAYDIARVEEVLEGAPLAMNLYRPLEATEDRIHFKVYNTGDPVPLSDIMPMLEHMDMKVISEVPFEVHPRDSEEPVWIHDFEAATSTGMGIGLSEVRDAFHGTFGHVWSGAMEDDGFNRLVLLAGLAPREVVILRAYCKFLRQATIPFSQDYMEETLATNPAIARELIALFMTRFDPTFKGKRDGACKKHASRIEEALEGVSNLDQDRIIRSFLSAILNTLRTNFFQKAADGGDKSYLSLKFASRELEDLPEPKPFREIFVYSPQVEGVHLRFGPVARGGLRWSDRREDFRTEILGLVKAQQVKNAVIVPVGSKGGFVIKESLPAEATREAAIEQGVRCYKTFIRGLLDITDNMVLGKVSPPEDVVRHDEDDPYLVVAADKGTATFSDYANEVSAEYNFWLDDAFASGGSAGYDHKAMGITARGAWESVKRHFRELGKDCQSEDFTVIGCGDMSGDVFGNGMLLSRHIRLLAAFNHLHIFIDPNPDAEKSFKERERLFKMDRSSWTDYDEKLISKGGGVFDRKAKSIELTPEIKKMLGLSAKAVTPNELIRAILICEAELLWFGGIGTYVKASHENHNDVGDRANDAIRVNANELRCKVIGEGANLGMTQYSRIEFAQRGGYLNTDSIDNSAGVDCSDHEVNIKILLRDIEDSGDMTRKQRDQLLEKMTEEVAALVLRDNYLQTQAISVTSGMSHHLLDRLARFMRSLEKAGRLKRSIEQLPDDEEIDERMKRSHGLTRPEISVLLSYAKIGLYDDILASDVPDEAYLEADLKAYFPEPLQKKYPERIESHRLSREITATALTNSIVNRVGITFVHEVLEKTGDKVPDVAKAYVIARQVTQMRDIWTEIEALDNKVATATQYALLIECGRLIERMAVWFLRHSERPLDIAKEVKRFQPDVDALCAAIGDVLPKDELEAYAAQTKRFKKNGAPDALARKVAAFPWLVPACDIVEIAETAKIDVEEAARAYFDIGHRFGFDWLRRAAGGLPSDNAWDKLAITAIVDDLYEHQSELTDRVLDSGGKKKAKPQAKVDSWMEERRGLVSGAQQLLVEMQAGGKPDLAMLAVANRRLKSMVGG